MGTELSVLPKEEWELKIQGGVLIVSVLENGDCNSIHHVGFRLEPLESSECSNVAELLGGTVFVPQDYTINEAVVAALSDNRQRLKRIEFLIENDHQDGFPSPRK